MEGNINIATCLGDRRHSWMQRFWIFHRGQSIAQLHEVYSTL